MPWGVYKPTKPYSTGGWSRPRPPRRRPPRFSLVSASRGAPPKTTLSPGVLSQLAGQSNAVAASGFDPLAGTNASGASSSDYPAFYDPFANMLSSLAAQKAAAEGRLRSNLTGREKAIQELYAAQNPLVEGNYNQAIKESAAVNDAVTNQLHNQGASTNADLLQKLSVIQPAQGAADQAAQQVKDYYSGLSGANYAMDAGDVQRLIGQLAEAKNYLAKQPGIIAQQLESEYQAAIADLESQFSSQQQDLLGQEGQAKSDYATSKYEHDQQVAKDAQDRKDQLAKDAEDRYWDNYWKQRDYLMKKLEIAQATQNKKDKLAAEKEMKALDRKKDIDIANIRANTSLSNAATQANTSTANNIRNNQTSAANNAATNASRNANKNKPKVVSGATVVKAKAASLNSVFNGTFVRDGVVNDGNVQAKVNNQLRAYGIDPYSSQGTAIRKWVFSQLNGKKNRQGRVWHSGKSRLPK